MTFTETNAYMVVLENKLIQAERELNEFRHIFGYFKQQLHTLGTLPDPRAIRPGVSLEVAQPVGSAGQDLLGAVASPYEGPDSRNPNEGPDSRGLFPGQSAPPKDGLDDPPQPEEKMQACYLEEPECVE